MIGNPRERDRRHVWHPWSPIAADRAGLLLVRGEGSRVWDAEGREFLDASSLNLTCGYASDLLAKTIEEQARSFHGFDISVGTHSRAGELAARLSGYLPAGMAKTILVNSGSEGVEAAITIASDYWTNIGAPRDRVVAFGRGYHGSTLIARSLSGLPRVGHSFVPPLPVTHVELPMAPSQLRLPDALAVMLAEFERAFAAGPEAPMAVVVEPFINVGGGIVLPGGFLRGLRDLCDRTGTLLVLDEVFTGYGRAGRMFGCLREDVAPDVLVSSKGLSGGYVPIGAVTVRDEVHDSFAFEPVIGGLRYGHTTSGHAIACAAALATLDLIEEEDLCSRAQEVGDRMRKQLENLVGTPDVVDVRSYGLVCAIEFATPEVAAEVAAEAKRNGVLVRQPGETIMLVPSLTVTDADAGEIAERVCAAVTSRQP